MEMVLVLPVVLLVLILVVEVAVVARTSLALVNAAREGARVAAVSVDTDAAIDAALDSLGPELASTMRVAVRRPPVVGETAEVTVGGSHTVLEVLGGFRIPLEFSASMRVER